LGATGRSRRAEPLQRGAGGVQVLLVPQRMGVAQRLAPISQGESGIEPLRLPKRSRRVLILEAVQQQHATDKLCLSRRRARRGKVDRSKTRCLSGQQRSSGQA